MPLTSTTNRVIYSGTGSAGPYLVPFRVTSANDLRVFHRDRNNVESPLAGTVDYTVGGFGQASATLTLMRPLPVGEVISIRRAPALTQPVALSGAATYAADTHEAIFDRITMQLQGLKDEIDRSLKVSETFDPRPMVLGLKPEPGKALVWQSTTELGNATIDSGGVVLPGAGRVVPTLSAYLVNNAVFNVKDFGAAGNGATDDSRAVQQAISAANAVAGERLAIRSSAAATVYFPPGSYLLSETLTPFPGVTLVGAGIWSTALVFGMPASHDGIVFTRTVPGYDRYQGFGWGGGIRDLKVTSADWNDPQRSCRNMVHVIGLVDFAMDRVMLTEGRGRLLNLDSVVSVTLSHISLQRNHGDCAAWIGSAGSVATTVRAFHVYQSQCRGGPGFDVGGLSLDFYGLIAESNGIGGRKEGSHGIRVRFGKVGLYSPYFEDNEDHDMCIGTEQHATLTSVIITNPTIQVSGTKLPAAGGVYLDHVAHATLQGGDLSACGRPVQLTPNCGHADLSYHAPGKPPLLTNGAHWRTNPGIVLRGSNTNALPVQTLTKGGIGRGETVTFSIPAISGEPAFLRVHVEVTFEPSANLRATARIDISKDGDGIADGAGTVTMIANRSAGNFVVRGDNFAVSFTRETVLVRYACTNEGGANQVRFFVEGVGIGGDVSLA
jgi:hypothetical protein